MVLLARFLGPVEFGIFAMTVFVNELAQMLVDFGMGSALVQRKEISQRILASCFWVNVAVGVAAAAVLLAASPLIAAYFKQPLVQGLLIGSALNILVSSVAVIPQSLLARELAFRDVTVATTIGSFCGAGVALGTAVMGFGVWALALQPLAGTIVATAIMFRRTGWRPTAEFELAGISGILKFSGHLLFSNVLGHVSRNVTSLILGPAMGAAALGKITMAQTITWLPVAQISQTVVRATYPVFAKLQDDMPKFRDGFYRATAMIALLAFPLMVGIGVLAVDLVPVAFGPKWSEVSTLVAITCVPAFVQCVATLSGTVLLGAGRSDILSRLALLALPVSAIPLWLAKEGSPVVVVAVLSASTVLLNLLTLATAMRVIDGSWRRYAGSTLRPAFCAFAMGLLLWVAIQLSPAEYPLVRLVLLSAAGAVIYAALTWLFNRTAAKEAIQLLGGFAGRR